MVALDIYSKCLKVQYKTHLCSKATIFTLITLITSIVVPFIFAYNSRGFWIKHDTFYEQPKVRFKGEYLFNGITNNIRKPIMCSNLAFLQDFTNSFDKCSLIKVREIDNNDDKKVDELRFTLSVNTENLKLLHFYILLTIEYNLATICPIQMQSAIIVHYSLNDFPISAINIDGHLGLTQLSPIYCHPKYRNLQYNYSVTQTTADVNNFDIKKIIQNYSKRNISTYLKYSYTTFNIGRSTSDLLINLKIKYPQHKVVYVPGFWQVIKWAWIQYLAIYVIIAWLIQKIRNYVFENKLLLFYELSPLKKYR